MKRAIGWPVAVALVVLGSRTIAYAISPSPLAAELSHQAGGPALPVITVVAILLALTFSAAVVWLATLGVHERRLLETRPLVAEPRLRLGLLAARALALWLVAMPAFAYLESTIHWREGLGWHGLHCLTGPVHRNAIPILGALSLATAALAAALEHVFAWMRRTLASIAGPRRIAGIVVLAEPHSATLLPPAAFAAPLGARGPPRIS
jgi:hypothetical protein